MSMICFHRATPNAIDARSSTFKKFRAFALNYRIALFDYFKVL